MKSIWFSIRATVTIVLVVTFCLFLMVFVYLGKIDGEKALPILQSVVVLALSYYFALKHRPNGEETLPEIKSRSLLGYSEQAKKEIATPKRTYRVGIPVKRVK